MQKEHWQKIAEGILEADSLRVASYCDLILKDDPDGRSRLKHLLTITNERLVFYKAPEDELKKLWMTTLQTAFSFRKYTKAEEVELAHFFWEIYNSL